VLASISALQDIPGPSCKGILPSRSECDEAVTFRFLLLLKTKNTPTMRAMNTTGIVTPIPALAPVESPYEMDVGKAPTFGVKVCGADPPELCNDAFPDEELEVVLEYRARSES